MVETQSKHLDFDSFASAQATKSVRPLFLILGTAFSLSIGWGIRGNFGHETGAMIPGALAAMAAAVLSGREDWLKRIPYFAFFGALGWSFGGSISYMQVIAYTHSGESLSVLYGFACLFVIGFLWASMGGAGNALPALLNAKQLSAFFPAITAVFVGWSLQDLALFAWDGVDPAFRQNDPLYWYDTDWLAALVAIGAVLALSAFRRRVDEGCSLVLHMAIGWWVGFLGLVVLLGLRMTPPRGDNWAGCVGMVGGMLIYFRRKNLQAVSYSAILAGIIGGIGFALADVLKLLGVATGLQTNWHSILEQTYGLINGLGIGMMMLWLRACVPDSNRPVFEGTPKWTKAYSTFFVLVVITYLNLTKNVGTWIKAGTVPKEMYGWSANLWFNLAYAALAILVLGILLAHQRRPISLLSISSLSKGQLFFLVFLWWVVIGNFERALAGFAPQRLVTEGIIFLNAILCSAIILIIPSPGATPENTHMPAFKLSKLFVVAFASVVVTTSLCWAATRLVYGNQPAPYANLHLRFGPNANATKAPPAKDKPHP